MTLEELFLSKGAEVMAIKRDCWHGTLAIDCKSCEDEADKAAEVEHREVAE